MFFQRHCARSEFVILSASGSVIVSVEVGHIVGYVTEVTAENTAKKTSKARILIFSKCLRARAIITAGFGASRRPSGKAQKGAHSQPTQPFLQRRQTGLIGVPKWVVIVARALRAAEVNCRNSDTT